MKHWLKFNVVGMVGFALQSVALFVLTHKAHSLNYLAATGLAVELAVLNNFAWHQRWTWKDRPAANRRESLRRLVKFNFTNGALSIGSNLIFMSLLVGRMGFPVSGANIITVAACSLMGFFLADRVAFEVSQTVR
jgi:putative flippase GtrA